MNLSTVGVTLEFAGRAEEAINFYASAVDAQVLFMMRVDEGPAGFAPELARNILHATFRVGETELFASDASYNPDAETAMQFEGFTLVIRTKTLEQAQRWFQSLQDGGHLVMPLSKTAFATAYGIVVDRFGVKWTVMHS